MCKNIGCRVIGTAGSTEGEALLKKIGVDAVYNHKNENYVTEIKKNEQNINVIVEMLANVNLQSDLDLIGKSGNGRILVSCAGCHDLESTSRLRLLRFYFLYLLKTLRIVCLFNSLSAGKSTLKIHYLWTLF